VDDVQAYHRLQSIPGVGKILALVLLYELHEVARFDHVGQFLSYARLVRCAHESAGKKLGSGGRKIGNAHLRWAPRSRHALLRQRSRPHCFDGTPVRLGFSTLESECEVFVPRLPARRADY
jgi:transposase